MRFQLLGLVMLVSTAVAGPKATKPASCLTSGRLEGMCWRKSNECAKFARWSKSTCQRADEYACFVITANRGGKSSELELCYRTLDECELVQARDAKRRERGTTSPCKLYTVAKKTR